MFEALLLHIGDLTGLKLGLETGYLDGLLRGFT
jgi:hypothetical protein